MAKKPKFLLDADRKAVLERVAQRMADTFRKLDLVMTIEGMHTLPAMTKAKGYRNLAVDPLQEFLFHKAFVGAKGQIIFCFEPADSQDFEYVDVEESKLDNVFPLLGPAYAAAVGIKDVEKAKLLILETEKMLLAEDAEEARQAQLDAEEAARESEVAYSDNPLFGKF